MEPWPQLPKPFLAVTPCPARRPLGGLEPPSPDYESGVLPVRPLGQTEKVHSSKRTGVMLSRPLGGLEPPFPDLESGVLALRRPGQCEPVYSSNRGSASAVKAPGRNRTSVSGLL